MWEPSRVKYTRPLAQCCSSAVAGLHELMLQDGFSAVTAQNDDVESGPREIRTPQAFRRRQSQCSYKLIGNQTSRNRP